ncbi:PAK-box/P21-Rho-binding family protein [Striga asiatica]|uniref:PAK-box/P21-Rho-binding family protein n=1 Tax=Striga asiatica TaxID=4170 RepID=A0A5A7RHE3_STRAF|nr:PAK-box/P21-Rho-binding family protein [Striga asiatica]
MIDYSDEPKNLKKFNSFLPFPRFHLFVHFLLQIRLKVRPISITGWAAPAGHDADRKISPPYCRRQTARYSRSAGKVDESFGSRSGESNRNPRSRQPRSSSRSSSVKSPSSRRRMRWFRRRLVQATSRRTSGDHEHCLSSGCGGLRGDPRWRSGSGSAIVSLSGNERRMSRWRGIKGRELCVGPRMG